MHSELIKLSAAVILIKAAGYIEDVQQFQHPQVTKVLKKFLQDSNKPITKEFVKKLDDLIAQKAADKQYKVKLLHQYNYDKWPEIITGFNDLNETEMDDVKDYINKIVLRGGPVSMPSPMVNNDMLLYLGDDEQIAAHELGHYFKGHITRNEKDFSRDRNRRALASTMGKIPLIGLALQPMISPIVKTEKEANEEAKKILEQLGSVYSNQAANRGIKSYRSTVFKDALVNNAQGTLTSALLAALLI